MKVENRGLVGAEVQAAGIDIDHGPGQPGAWQYTFAANNITEWGFPCRADGHATRAWFETEDHIRGFVDRLYAARGLAPGWWILAGCGYVVLLLGLVCTTQWAKATASRLGS